MHWETSSWPAQENKGNRRGNQWKKKTWQKRGVTNRNAFINPFKSPQTACARSVDDLRRLLERKKICWYRGNIESWNHTHLVIVRHPHDNHEKDSQLGDKDKGGNGLSAIEVDKKDVDQHLQDALENLEENTGIRQSGRLGNELSTC